MLDIFPIFVNIISYSQPMRIALLIFHLWLYYGDSRGALLLSSLARKKLNELGFLGYIDIMLTFTNIELRI